ncbi:MAG: EAL domain-containing protein [Deltaproteobacteria bacterium]|nr:EAL domain-containing protein [Deltaproteobacteria bacterium]
MPHLEPQPLPQPWFDLGQILDEERILTHFQPLVSVNGGRVVGVEALARGLHPQTGELIPPDQLFRAAAREGRLVALDRLCRRTAMQTFASLPCRAAPPVLFLNFEASLLDQGVLNSGILHRMTLEAGLEPNRVVIEVVESRVRDQAALECFAKSYRDRGFLLALDDVGSGHSNLERLAALQPDVIKIDRSLITDLDREFYKQEVTRSLVNLAQRVGALVVGEGVERQEEAVLALALGVDLLQGFFLARPGPLVGELEGVCRAQMKKVADGYRRLTMDRYFQRKRQSEQFLETCAEIAEQLAGAPPTELDRRLDRVMDTCHGLECLYVLNSRGRQISETVCHPSRLKGHRQAIFQPAPRGRDQSLKSYYLLLKAGQERYVSEPYISQASGNLCVTVSLWFNGAKGNRMIICADFPLPGTVPVPA